MSYLAFHAVFILPPIAVLAAVLAPFTRRPSASPQTASPHTGGSPTAGPATADPQSADPQSADPQSADPPSDDPPSADPQSTGLPSADLPSAGPPSARPGRRPAACLAAVAGIALVYTTPWDNYLVRRGIWSYGPDRVLATIGYVPVEEYLFFVLQPVLTGLWLFHVLARGRAREPARRGGRRTREVAGRAADAAGPAATVAPRVPDAGLAARTEGPPTPPDAAGPAGAATAAGSATTTGATARWIGAVAYLGVTAAGALLLRREAGTYLGLILVWAGPVLAAQWAYAGAGIWAHRRAWLLGALVPTLYLWAADAAAIRLGIWSIAEPTTTGVRLLWLPLEEAVFFLATNLMVVQGLLLFLFPPGSHAAARPHARAAAP